jgi:hypothetical protein
MLGMTIRSHYNPTGFISFADWVGERTASGRNKRNAFRIETVRGVYVFTSEKPSKPSYEVVIDGESRPLNGWDGQ